MTAARGDRRPRDLSVDCLNRLGVDRDDRIRGLCPNEWYGMKRRILVMLLFALVIAGFGLLFSGCHTTYPRRNPLGESFPEVKGETLNGMPVRLPDDFAGKPALLLIGYEQDTQFDLDRWLFGLQQAEVTIAVREVPTIPGLGPRMFAGAIDSGMRRGIPDEDWGSVITLYSDAEPVAKFTGNDNTLPGRLVLLDATGRVAFFHDEGYSVGVLNRLREVIAAME